MANIEPFGYVRRTEEQAREDHGHPTRFWHLHYLAPHGVIEEVVVSAVTPESAISRAMAEHGGYAGARHMTFCRSAHPDLPGDFETAMARDAIAALDMTPYTDPATGRAL